MANVSNRDSLTPAYLSALLNASIIGFSYLFLKVALDYAAPTDTLMLRFAVAFIAMSIPVALGWIKLNYVGKPLYKMLLLATMYPLGFFALQAFGLKYATSAEGGILLAFAPVITVVLASVFLREKTNVLQKLSVVVSVIGVVSIFVANGLGIDGANMTGIVLLFLSCVATAGFAVFARSLRRLFSPMELTYFLLGVGFVTFTIWSLVTHARAGTLALVWQPLTNTTFVASLLYLGIMSSFLTALTQTYTLSKIGAAKASVFTNLSTVISMVAGAVFRDEQITSYHVIGAALIIAGVVGTNLLGGDRVPGEVTDEKPVTQ